MAFFIINSDKRFLTRLTMSGSFTFVEGYDMAYTWSSHKEASDLITALQTHDPKFKDVSMFVSTRDAKVILNIQH